MGTEPCVALVKRITFHEPMQIIFYDIFNIVHRRTLKKYYGGPMVQRWQYHGME